MNLETQGPCEGCKTNNPHDGLEPIGNPVRSDEGISGYTDYSFSQCRDCGSVWTQYRDHSPAGGGRFSKRLTEGLF